MGLYSKHQPVPDHVCPLLQLRCALIWAQVGRCYPTHSGASLCKHNTNVKLLFLLLFVKGFPSQWRQIAVGTAFVFGRVTLGMYLTDLYCNTGRKILSGLLSNNAKAFHLVLLCLIKINTPRGLSNTGCLKSRNRKIKQVGKNCSAQTCYTKYMNLC